MHIDNVIFLILSKNAYTKFSAGPTRTRETVATQADRLIISNFYIAKLFAFGKGIAANTDIVVARNDHISKLGSVERTLTDLSLNDRNPIL